MHFVHIQLCSNKKGSYQTHGGMVVLW